MQRRSPECCGCVDRKGKKCEKQKIEVVCLPSTAGEILTLLNKQCSKATPLSGSSGPRFERMKACCWSSKDRVKHVCEGRDGSREVGRDEGIGAEEGAEER